MHWIKTPEERANPLEDPNTPIGKALMSLGDFTSTISGRSVSDGTALSLAAFYNGVSIIAGDMATVPLKVYRKRDDGGREEEMGHSLTPLLSLQPADMITSAAWREAAQGHLLLRGNAYTEILTNNAGRITGLVLLSPNSVTRKGFGYEVRNNDGRTRMVSAANMLHVANVGSNGIDGWSVIRLARESLSLAVTIEESNAAFIANASRPSGFISTPEPISPEAARRLKQQWSDKNTGSRAVGNVPVLDGGITWQQVGLNAEDTQYLESRRFSVNEVARWLNIPLPKIKDLERATFSNIEELMIEYVRGTLRPWAVRWEQAMNTKLLTERERAQGLFIEFNLDGLLRGDTESRANSQRSYFEIGAITTNEVRAHENRNPIAGGDRAFVRMDMMPLDKVDEVQSVVTDDEGRTEVRFFDPNRHENRHKEVRSPSARLALRNSFLALFLSEAVRLVRGEARDVRRILSREQDFLRAIAEYYLETFPSFAMDVMGPVFRSYADSVSMAAANEINADVQIDTVTYADSYNEVFATRYSAASRQDLTRFEDSEQVELRIAEWTDGTSTARPKHEQVADREVVRLGDAVSRATWVAGGIATFVWRTVGDTCPYCRKLDGKVVSRTTPFLFKGEELEGDEGDSALVPRSDINHAPAHRGCDCTIIPRI